jgi:hypothetical protein
MKYTSTGKDLIARYSYLTKSELNGKIVLSECKAIGKTKKQEIEDLSVLFHDKSSKHNTRNKPFVFEKTDYVQKLKNMKLNLIKNCIEINYNINTNNGLTVVDKSEYNFSIDEETDWNYYAKSYRFPKVWKTMRICLPADKINRKHICYDGIVNTEVFSERNISGMTILLANCLITKKGNRIQPEKKFVAILDNTAYHADSLKKAIAGLNRKIKNNLENKTEKVLTVESYITKNFYHKLTGACFTGIENFIEQNNLQGRNRIQVKELLSISNNFYGREKLIETIK